jgi:hypothetical protein
VKTVTSDDDAPAAEDEDDEDDIPPRLLRATTSKSTLLTPFTFHVLACRARFSRFHMFRHSLRPPPLRPVPALSPPGEGRGGGRRG